MEYLQFAHPSLVCIGEKVRTAFPVSTDPIQDCTMTSITITCYEGKMHLCNKLSVTTAASMKNEKWLHNEKWTTWRAARWSRCCTCCLAPTCQSPAYDTLAPRRTRGSARTSLRPSWR